MCRRQNGLWVQVGMITTGESGADSIYFAKIAHYHVPIRLVIGIETVFNGNHNH